MPRSRCSRRHRVGVTLAAVFGGNDNAKGGAVLVSFPWKERETLGRMRSTETQTRSSVYMQRSDLHVSDRTLKIRRFGVRVAWATT